MSNKPPLFGCVFCGHTGTAVCHSPEDTLACKRRLPQAGTHTPPTVPSGIERSHHPETPSILPPGGEDDPWKEYVRISKQSWNRDSEVVIVVDAALAQTRAQHAEEVKRWELARDRAMDERDKLTAQLATAQQEIVHWKSRTEAMATLVAEKVHAEVALEQEITRLKGETPQ